MHAWNSEREKSPLGSVHKALLDQFDASNRDVGGPRLARSDGDVGDGGWLLTAEVGERPHDIALSWSRSFPSRSIETVVDRLPGGLETDLHVIRIYDVGPSCIPYVLAYCLEEVGIAASDIECRFQRIGIPLDLEIPRGDNERLPGGAGIEKADISVFVQSFGVARGVGQLSWQRWQSGPDEENRRCRVELAEVVNGRVDGRQEFLGRLLEFIYEDQNADTGVIVKSCGR